MKKTKLIVEYEYEFQIYGISSLLRPFQLAWHLNQAFQAQFLKGDDHFVHIRESETCSYLQYIYKTPLSTLRLFRNKPNEVELTKWPLVPEHAHFDYIFFAKTEDEELKSKIVPAIKDIPSVELVAFIPLPASKTKDNFIFN